MATERLSMRKTKEILRQKWTLGCSHRQVEASLGVAISTVSETLNRARAAGLKEWRDIEAIPEDALEERLYPPPPSGQRRPLPDPLYLHRELHRKGVTLVLLHAEYLEQHAPATGTRSSACTPPVWCQITSGGPTPDGAVAGASMVVAPAP